MSERSTFVTAAVDLAKGIKDFCDNEVPDEWDGGSVGYSLGGLYSMATEVIEAAESDRTP